MERDKGADGTEESALQGEDDGRKNRKFASCTVNQNFSYKSGIGWR